MHALFSRVGLICESLTISLGWEMPKISQSCYVSFISDDKHSLKEITLWSAGSVVSSFIFSVFRLWSRLVW